MIHLLVYLIFILTVAMAAGGISLSARLRSGPGQEIFSSLLYFEVFAYTFGFYGLWGQFVINGLLADKISTGLLLRFSEISILLGLPFLVFAWLMLIQFSLRLSGRASGMWFVPSFLVFNFSALILLGYLVTRKETENHLILFKYYFIAAHFIWLFIASYLIHFPVKARSILNEYEQRVIAPVIFLIMLTQCFSLLFYSTQVLLALVFIFIFFAGNTFLPVWFTYGRSFKTAHADILIGLPFEEFCKRYDISPRESEIIREICNGLTNKDIAKKLFISLQTVKDHTHRIYIKTNVKNRVQLINLVKEGGI